MIKASVGVGLFGLALLVASITGAVGLPFYLPVATLLTAGVLVVARGAPKFLRIFICMLSAMHVLFVLLQLGALGGLITGDYRGYVPPPSSALGATAFAMIIYALSYVPV